MHSVWPAALQVLLEGKIRAATEDVQMNDRQTHQICTERERHGRVSSDKMAPQADKAQMLEQRKQLLFSLSLKDAHVFACTCVCKRDTHYINKANGFLCLICLAAEEIRSSESRSLKQPGSLQFIRRE